MSTKRLYRGAAEVETREDDEIIVRQISVSESDSGEVRIKDNIGEGEIVLFPGEVTAVHEMLNEYVDLGKLRKAEEEKANAKHRHQN